MDNIFTTLAKQLATRKIKRELTVVGTEDPTLAASIESLKFHIDNVNRLLANVCKRNPNSPHCKEKGKK